MNRYQLVAIDNATNTEYVVELNNDSKENKAPLGFIDHGLSRFKDDYSLAKFLYEKGVIPTLNVTFKIKYRANKKDNYLTPIYNDAYIYHVSGRVDNKVDAYDDFLLFVIRTLLIYLSKEDFYDFVLKENRKNGRRKYSGDFVDNRVINTINDYYNMYIVPKHIDANSAEIQYTLLKEFTQYKQLRCLYKFIKDYDNTKEKIIEPAFNLKAEQLAMTDPPFNYFLDASKEEFKEPDSITVREDLYDKVLRLYELGGMEAVYEIYDLDDIYQTGGVQLVLK